MKFFVLTITFCVTASIFACHASGAGRGGGLVDSSNVDDSGSNSPDIRKDAPKGVSEAFYTCIDKAGQNLTIAGFCITKEKKAQDARLNKVYKELIAALKPNSKDSLIAAERAWLDSTNKDGTFEATIYSSEQVDDLEQSQNDMFRLCERANLLEKYLKLAKGN